MDFFIVYNLVNLWIIRYFILFLQSNKITCHLWFANIFWGAQVWSPKLVYQYLNRHKSTPIFYVKTRFLVKCVFSSSWLLHLSSPSWVELILPFLLKDGSSSIVNRSFTLLFFNNHTHKQSLLVSWVRGTTLRNQVWRYF